jgi:hypothetical protein
MLGVSYIYELKRQIRILRDFVGSLPELRREICELLTPTQEALERSGVKFAGLEQYPEVRQLERVLGRSGADDQRIAITRAETRLSAVLDKLEAERKSKGSVFAAVSLSAGLMAAIILI